MCGKGTEKNQVAARLMSGCGAPFWRSRPLTAGKGVQHKEKGRNLKSDAAGPLFGGSGTPAAQKGARQLENEKLKYGTPNEQAAGPLLAAAQGAIRGPAPGKR